MNFSFYILGTPNGYNQYPADNNSTAFQEFAQHNATESQLTVNRSGQLVYYAYMRRLQEKTSNFLGFCLVFNGVYCRNPKKLFDLFDRAFYDVQLKGEFLKFDKGKANYVIGKFAEKPLEVERIKTFLKNNLDNDFTRDFTNLPPAFKFGNGSKTISVKENDIDIINTIAEFEIVHIANNEKSLSELERIQKMLSDLYTEKQTLQQNYSKLLGQKKQYRAVLFLCFVVIGCAVGLFAFNRNIQSKDSKIQSLQSDISEKNDTISSQHSNITQLQITKQKLNMEIIDLQETVNQKSTVIENKSTEIQNLTNENSNLSSTNRNLQSELREQKNQNQRLSSDLANTKKSNSTSISTSSFTHYKVTVSRAYCYYRCADNFYKTDCYYSQDETISVYYQFGGYGLTAGGYLKMSELTRY